MENTIKPKYHLLIHNIIKPKNFGMLLRSAAAFGLDTIFLISKDVEEKKKSKILKNFALFFGDKGTTRKLKYEVFTSIKEAHTYFKANEIYVVGVEIGHGAKNIHTKPFNGETVFVMGNEGEGLIPALKKICDYFVYIPQYTNKTASLNVSIAGSIIFHHFASWAGYDETAMIGEKFQDPENKPNTTFLHFKIHGEEENKLKAGESNNNKSGENLNNPDETG